jgi:hypothetical protein
MQMSDPKLRALGVERDGDNDYSLLMSSSFKLHGAANLPGV